MENGSWVLRVALLLMLVVFGSLVVQSATTSPVAAQESGADGLLAPSYQCFTPSADTFAWDWFGSNQGSNYGAATTVDVASIGDTSLDRRYAFLLFDLGTIPAGSVVLSADLELYLTDIDGTGAQTYTRLEAAETTWSESTATWNSQPLVTSTKYDEQTVSDLAGWKTWDATTLTSEWVTSSRANHGLAIQSGGVGSPPAHFHSREGSSDKAPRLCVEWQAYRDILDPDSIGWRSGRNYGSSAFGEWFNATSAQGFMIIDIEVDEIDGNQRVAGVWQKNTDNRAWAEFRNMSKSEFETKQQEQVAAGKRMIDQEVYTLGGNTRYAAVWIQNKENLQWINYYDVAGDAFSLLFSQYSDMGYLMIDVDAYVQGDQLRYSAVWVQNVEDLDWVEWRNLTSEQFAAKFDQYKGQYRMIDVESYRHGDQQYYAGIWVENTNGRRWAEWRNMTSKEFGERWAQLRDAGYRLIDFEVYPTGSSWRYAGIWRQNSDRPDWSPKTDVDSHLEDQVSEHTIPGMSVAVAQNGQWRYLRGFGDADVANSVAADSRTIFRLASVSKGIASVLAMRLQEQGFLDVSANSRDYVNEMPIHHTHTVSQTLSNRSGIGHYCKDPCDYPDWKSWLSGEDDTIDHFDTALDAAMRLWDAPLVYPPPGSTYKYSTFGYTFAGASMEEAVGSPIADILDDHLRTPYNLNTLRAEDRDVPNAKRSLVYSNNNEETTADDTSYKILGGGIESSAYDLARFGIQLLNDNILTSASRTTMWTAPNAWGCGGGVADSMGWCVGTESGTPFVSKGGHQLGSNTYIRMYPDEDIVIVVLTNRKGGGHQSASMAKEIGSLMLAELPLTSIASQTPKPKDGQQPMAIEIDEPAQEGLPAEYVVWPVSRPVAQPSDDDLQEPDQEFEASHKVFLPMAVR